MVCHCEPLILCNALRVLFFRWVALEVCTRKAQPERARGMDRRRCDIVSMISRSALMFDPGDRVQWFRAEAEMQRWQEQWEAKQADFMRCIQSYKKMSEVWAQLAASSDTVGRAAYARRTSAMYDAMAQSAKALFISAGYQDRILTEDKTLADFIEDDRQHPDNEIPYLNIHAPFEESEVRLPV